MRVVKLGVILLALVLFGGVALYAQMPMEMPYGFWGAHAQGGMEMAGQSSLENMINNLRTMVYKVAKSNNDHKEIKAVLEIASELGLNENQVSRLRQLDWEHQKFVIRKNAAALEAVADVESFLTAPNLPDKEKVANKVIEAMGAVADIYQNCLETNLEVKSLLTPEQNKSLDTLSRVMTPKSEMPPMMMKMKDKMQKHQGMMMDDPQMMKGKMSPRGGMMEEEK